MPMPLYILKQTKNKWKGLGDTERRGLTNRDKKGWVLPQSSCVLSLLFVPTSMFHVPKFKLNNKLFSFVKLTLTSNQDGGSKYQRFYSVTTPTHVSIRGCGGIIGSLLDTGTSLFQLPIALLSTQIFIIEVFSSRS